MKDGPPGLCPVCIYEFDQLLPVLPAEIMQALSQVVTDITGKEFFADFCWGVREDEAVFEGRRCSHTA